MKIWNRTWKFFFIFGFILGYLGASFLFYWRNELFREDKKSFFYYLNPLVNYRD